MKEPAQDRGEEMNNYKPNPILLEESYRRSYHKFAAVAEINSTSFLIDASPVKLRGWEVAVFPLEKNHTFFNIETDDPEIFSKSYPGLKIIPRSVFLMAVQDKVAARKAFDFIMSAFSTQKEADIETILSKLNNENALQRLNILASAEAMQGSLESPVKKS